MENLKIIYIPTEQLIFADYNPRKATDTQIEKLKASISNFGFVDPIIVNEFELRKNIIIGGHLRVECARQLNIPTVPVVYVCIPDLDKEKELNLRLNKNGGDFDLDMLANEFDISFLKEIGFTEIELGLNIDKLADELLDEKEEKEIECPACGHKFTNEKKK